eukprot:1748605-Alexandrium_andersonii.AAC.1
MPLLPAVCRTVEDSSHWAAFGVQQAALHSLKDKISNVVGTRWVLSSGCSGILTFELGARSAAKALQCHVECAWACEKNKVCQEEMLAMDAAHQPCAIFDNYDDFLHPSIRAGLKHLDPAADDF